MTEKPRTLYVTNRAAWREWLERNFEKEKDIWLVYPRKSTGKKRIEYNEAVEEALCFGWIDSKIKALDDRNSIQRFSPRKPKSGYSQTNKERLKWLLQEGLVHPSVIDEASKAASEIYDFPADIIESLRKEQAVWDNYNNFSEPYKRIRIAYIDSARERPEEFQKRLANFISKTRENKHIGFGGVEKYY